MMRVGIGYDIHPLVEGRKMILGGVPIDFPLGLQGHSDADVLVHAVIDAVLGAAGEGDIGRLFPDTDPAFRGISSLKLLEKVAERVRKKGLRLINLDATVILEKPRISDLTRRMSGNIARALGVEPEVINIKATTNEGMDATGTGRAAAALAAALMVDHASFARREDAQK